MDCRDTEINCSKGCEGFIDYALIIPKIPYIMNNAEVVEEEVILPGVKRIILVLSGTASGTLPECLSGNRWY